jgi:hypothetical protein
MFYPVKVTLLGLVPTGQTEPSSSDPKVWEVTSRDFPQLAVRHDSKAAALELMGHMLLHSMSNIATAYERIPEPSAKHTDEEMVSIGLSAWMRVQLFNALIASGMNYELLIHKAGMSRQQVDNLLDFYCRVPVEDFELAMQQLDFFYDVRLRSIDSLTAT